MSIVTPSTALTTPFWPACRLKYTLRSRIASKGPAPFSIDGDATGDKLKVVSLVLIGMIFGNPSVHPPCLCVSVVSISLPICLPQRQRDTEDAQKPKLCSYSHLLLVNFLRKVAKRKMV